MKHEDIRKRLDTLHIYVDHEMIGADEAEQLAKRAAMHFDIPEQLVSVVAFKSRKQVTFDFCYNWVSVVRYTLLFGEEMKIGWVEKCILRMIGEILVGRHPRLEPEEIRKMFNK